MPKTLEQLLSEKEKEQIRLTIDQLSWLGRQTRPDILSNICRLSGAYKEATVADIAYANKTIKKWYVIIYQLIFLN